jgi:putative heme iron utilization protein
MTAAAARRLLQRARSGALATTSCREEGWPFASLVTVACDCDGAPLFLFSQLAEHTRNLAADSRAALLTQLPYFGRCRWWKSAEMLGFWRAVFKCGAK